MSGGVVSDALCLELEECQALCSASPLCVGFNMHKDLPRCFLHSYGGDGGGCTDMVEDPIFDSYVKLNNPGSGYDTLEIEACEEFVAEGRCPSGTEGKTFDQPAFCVGDQCALTCCLADPSKCFGFSCGAGFVRIADSDGLDRGVNARANCCIQAETCGFFPCNPTAGFAFAPSKVSLECSTSPCSQEECCDADPTRCRGYACPEGTVLNISALGQRLGDDPDTTCCEEAPPENLDQCIDQADDVLLLYGATCAGLLSTGGRTCLDFLEPDTLVRDLCCATCAARRQCRDFNQWVVTNAPPYASCTEYTAAEGCTAVTAASERVTVAEVCCSSCSAGLVPEDYLPEQERSVGVLSFSPVQGARSGRYKVCFCDHELLPSDMGHCHHEEDFAVEVGYAYVTGLSCLLREPKYNRLDCRSQRFGGLVCGSYFSTTIAPPPMLPSAWQ